MRHSSRYNLEHKSGIEEAVINFGFYSPHKSSAPLRVYFSKHVIEELKEVAGQCFKDIKFGKNPKKLRFPRLMEYYENGFNAKKSMDLFKASILNCLPKTQATEYEKYLWYTLFSNYRSDKYPIYEKLNFDFTFHIFPSP